MEALNEKMNDILQKCKMMEEFVSLHLRRKKIVTDLTELRKKTEKAKKYVRESSQILDEDHQNSTDEYMKIINRIQDQQILIFKIIEKIIRMKTNARNEILSHQKSSKKIPSVSTINKLNAITPLAMKMLQNQQTNETPRMYLSDYEKSPYVKSRGRPISLQFSDFEALITEKMFKDVPQYMRGRITFAELNSFLEEIIVPCFNYKYQLMYKPRECVNTKDQQLWLTYKDQTAYFPNQKFITQGDIARKTQKMIDNKMKSKITILRHLGVLQERHNSQTTCYIWLAD